MGLKREQAEAYAKVKLQRLSETHMRILIREARNPDGSLDPEKVDKILSEEHERLTLEIMRDTNANG